MKKITKPTKQKDITRSWHLIDVKGKILGRVATEIALKLMGKSKSNYTRNLDFGDFVVITNARLVEVSGAKEKVKVYTRYSGYPGGLKKKALWQVRNEKPKELIRHAVWGMLPKNKLRDRLITRLYVFPDENHPFTEQIKY